MTIEYRAADHATYRMDMKNPHRVIEPEANEITVVDGALQALVAERMLPCADYDHGPFDAMRKTVAAEFEIPWTAITPRMQRLIYAINAIHRPARMLAMGIFCGNTFISNAGAAVGPGACYEAEKLVGVEIKTEEADRARRNVARLDKAGRAEILGADGVEVARAFDGTIDLLYLDASGPARDGSDIYFDILEAALDKLPAGRLVLAHNSVNAADTYRRYLQFVRDSRNFRQSVNMIVDGEGLEVSVR